MLLEIWRVADFQRQFEHEFSNRSIVKLSNGVNLKVIAKNNIGISPKFCHETLTVNQ